MRVLKINEYLELKGANQVARDIGRPITTVANWKKLKRVPTPTSAQQLIDHASGLLTWESIYQPFAELRGQAND